MDSIISYTFACTRYLQPLGFNEDLIKIIVGYAIETCVCKCATQYCTYTMHHDQSVGLTELHLCKYCDNFMKNDGEDGRRIENDISLVCAQVNTTPSEALSCLIKNEGDIVNTIMEMQF